MQVVDEKCKKATMSHTTRLFHTIYGPSAAGIDGSLRLLQLRRAQDHHREPVHGADRIYRPLRLAAVFACLPVPWSRYAPPRPLSERTSIYDRPAQTYSRPKASSKVGISRVRHCRLRELIADANSAGALPVVAPRQRSASDSPPVEIESIAKASTSTSTSSGRQSKKRKKQIELTLAESSDEDDGSDLRAKVAKVEAASGEARVKTEPGKRVKFEPGVKAEKVNVKVSRENGKVVLDILDD